MFLARFAGRGLAQTRELLGSFARLALCALQLRFELFDVALFLARLRFEPLRAIAVAAQRTHQFLLALELRAHPFELEIATSHFRTQLRNLFGIAAKRFDQGVLPVDALLQRLELVLAPSRAGFELGDARPLLLELFENQRELRAPIGQQAGQAISQTLDRCSRFRHLSEHHVG